MLGSRGTEGTMASMVDILIVEDTPDDAALLLRALRRHQLAAQVAVAQDGPEALDFLVGTGAPADRRPKLILLDLKLPRMTGLEVLRRLKADPRTRPIPVVIFTSSAQERDVAESYHICVNSYVTKPLDWDALVEVVRQIGSYWLGVNRSAAS
jgi:two-component system, response regulator